LKDYLWWKYLGAFVGSLGGLFMTFIILIGFGIGTLGFELLKEKFINEGIVCLFIPIF